MVALGRCISGPAPNGIVERFHKTMLDEFYRIAFRKKLYETIEDLQTDLDLWMGEFNEARRFAQPRALSRKVSDEYTVPVCRLHHRELHRYGHEASWWAGTSIDPLPIALELWRRSRSVKSM
jgi:hypothetical protein